MCHFGCEERGRIGGDRGFKAYNIPGCDSRTHFLLWIFLLQAQCMHHRFPIPWENKIKSHWQKINTVDNTGMIR